jgi:hypothetical protein
MDGPMSDATSAATTANPMTTGLIPSSLVGFDVCGMPESGMFSINQKQLSRADPALESVERQSAIA